MSVIHKMNPEQLLCLGHLDTDPDRRQALRASMEEQGWALPILIDCAGVVLYGQERLETMKELGHTEVPCMFREFLSCSQEYQFSLMDRILAKYVPWIPGAADLAWVVLRGIGVDLEDFGGD